MAQDESRGAAARGWAVRAKTHQRPPQADYGPVRQCDSVHPLAQPRGNLGFPDDPSAQRRRGIAPKKIATFNTHPEAPEPMAGAR